VAVVGTVRVGDDQEAVGVEMDDQLVPEAAAVEPGVPTATVMDEEGKSTEVIGKPAELV
jgi:hypothetical protein